MNPAGILLNDTIRSYSLHFIANSSSSWSLTLALQQSHDLFVSGSPPIHREWKKATTSNLKLSGHFFWKRIIDSLLIIHQTCICSCSMFFHFQNEDINFSLFQQISAGTFAKKKAWRKRMAFSCDMESGLKHLAWVEACPMVQCYDAMVN